MTTAHTPRLIASIIAPTIASTIAAAIALVAACAGLLVAAGPASAAEAKFKVVSHNLGSDHDNIGLLAPKKDYNGHSSIEDPIDRVIQVIRADNPHVALLQEVCERDVQRMLDELGAPWVASTFAATQPAKAYPDPNGWNNSCERMRERSMGKGNVMLTRLPIWAGEDLVTEVGYHDGRHITLACMNVAWGGVLGGRVQACNTHLSAGREKADRAARTSQAKQIRTMVNATEAQVPMVLGGDFNSLPKTGVVDKFHAVNRNGTAFNKNRFYEGDHQCATAFGFCRDGVATHGAQGDNPRKIDHVFFGRKWTKFPASVELDTQDSATSYHDVITARTKFKW